MNLRGIRRQAALMSQLRIPSLTPRHPGFQKTVRALLTAGGARYNAGNNHDELMPPRRDPYAAFTYLISLGATVVGGFSEVIGLGSGTSITLKRGASGPVLIEWLKAAHDGAADPRRITITQVDAARRPARTWALRGALPKKYVGATLNAAGNEVAMEEIQLTCDGIEPAS